MSEWVASHRQGRVRFSHSECSVVEFLKEVLNFVSGNFRRGRPLFFFGRL